MHILSVGAAFPPTEITDATLAQIDPNFKSAFNFGIEKRFSCLKPEALGASVRNYQKIGESLVETPTSVAVRAVKQALERAGITQEQIGMIIGDNGTPIETTPSEGQRVGEALGLKVPAYDITGGSAALFVHLDTLRKMKPERMPEYVLCISASMMTTRIGYSEGEERCVFGDGAVALVVSSKHSGGLSVEATRLIPFPAGRRVIELGIFGKIRVQFEELKTLSQHATHELDLLREKVPGIAGSYIVPTQIFSNSIAPYLEQLGSGAGRVWIDSPRHGYVFGSSSLIPLALRWDQLKKGDQIVAIESGTGPLAASLVVRRVS